MRHLFLTRMCLLVGLILVPTTASAYIDPGVWTWALTILVATSSGFYFSVKRHLHSFFQRLRRKFRLDRGRVRDPKVEKLPKEPLSKGNDGTKL